MEGERWREVEGSRGRRKGGRKVVMEVTLWVTLSVREGEGESGRLGWGSPHTHTHTLFLGM